MTDRDRDQNQEEKEEVIEDGVDQKKEEKEEQKEEPREMSEIFVTEEDLFDVSSYHYKDDGQLFVKDVDEDFDENKEANEFIMTFKKPSQGDANAIQTTSRISGEEGEDIALRDFMQLEFTRFLVLMRSWSLKEEITNESILELNPKIVRAILNGIRDKIGTEGII